MANTTIKRTIIGTIICVFGVANILNAINESEMYTTGNDLFTLSSGDPNGDWFGDGTKHEEVPNRWYRYAENTCATQEQTTTVWADSKASAMAQVPGAINASAGGQVQGYASWTVTYIPNSRKEKRCYLTDQPDEMRMKTCQDMPC